MAVGVIRGLPGRFGVSTERKQKKQKKTHTVQVENYVLFRDITENYIAQDTASQIALRNCSKEVREQPGYIRVFAETKQNM